MRVSSRVPGVLNPGRNIGPSWPAATACLLGLSSLTDAQVGVDRGIAGSAGQVLVFPVGDMLVCAGIAVLLGQAEVNDVDQVALLPQSHEEVVRLHVPVDEILGVDVLDAADLKEGRTQQVAQHRDAHTHVQEERPSLSMKGGSECWLGFPKQ